MLAVDKTGFCVGLQNKIRHLACCHTLMVQVSVPSARGIYTGSETSVIVSLGWHFENVNIILTFRERLVYSAKCEVCFVGFCEIFNNELWF